MAPFLAAGAGCGESSVRQGQIETEPHCQQGDVPMITIPWCVSAVVFELQFTTRTCPNRQPVRSSANVMGCRSICRPSDDRRTTRTGERSCETENPREERHP